MSRYSLNSFSRSWSSSRTSTNMVQAHGGSRPLEPPTLRSSDMHPMLVLNCCHVFEFQVLCIFALILRSVTIHCRIPYYGRLRARPVSVNAYSDQVDGRWMVEPSPSYARTNVRPYPYYGMACTPSQHHLNPDPRVSPSSSNGSSSPLSGAKENSPWRSPMISF